MSVPAGLQIIIVAENASARFGGESVLPLHYFKRLQDRGVPVKLVVHDRVKPELEQTLGSALRDVVFVRDSRLQMFLSRVSTLLPTRVADFTTSWVISLETSIRQRKTVKDIIRAGFGTVIHQPVPVSPKLPSLMYGFGKPVIIGPMNGGMDFPPAFLGHESALSRAIVRFGRTVSEFVNAVVKGKREAALLLYANERTAAALPRNATQRRALLIENGVDVNLWRAPPAVQSGPPTFLYLGRLVGWKAVDILIHAAASVVRETPIRLRIVGDGPESARLRALAQELGIASAVEFLGFVPQVECPQLLSESRALVLSSLYECGGAVVLEAMCASRPVIATDWGGPADYLTSDCGFLVQPTSREEMIREFARTMLLLAKDPTLAATMGAAGRQRAIEKFDWERKIDAMLDHYAAVAMPEIASSSLTATSRV